MLLSLLLLDLKNYCDLTPYFSYFDALILFWAYFVLHGPTVDAFVDQVWIDDKRKTGFQQRLENM